MEIEKEVAEFVDTIKKDPFKYYFQNKENKKVKWEEDKVYVDALYQGYLDACRTFKWEKDGKDNKEYIREIFEEKEIVQLDFIVWSKMQKIMAAESFIKTFKDDDEENKEVINSEELEPYDILNLKTTLENRLSEIRPLICK